MVPGKKKNKNKQARKKTVTDQKVKWARVSLLMSHYTSLQCKNISISKSRFRYGNLFPLYSER